MKLPPSGQLRNRKVQTVSNHIIFVKGVRRSEVILCHMQTEALEDSFQFLYSMNPQQFYIDYLGLAIILDYYKRFYITVNRDNRICKEPETMICLNKHI